MFPDVAQNILAATSPGPPGSEGPPGTGGGPRRSFIVDSELVAVDRAKGGKLRAFQDLSTR